jgi:hypothetical protein
LKVALKPRQIVYGHDVTVSGTASPADAGQRLLLEFAPLGSSKWRALTATRVGRHGRFRLVAPLRHSGFVRVVGAGGAANASAISPAVTGASALVTAGIAPSRSQRVAVAAEFRLPAPAVNLLVGQTADIRGRLLPARAGRKIRLEGRSGGGWHWLASARTGPRGGFDFRYGTGGTGVQQLRVRFAGDRLNTRSSSGAGQLTVFRESLASWYSDGGSTACGFHAFYGVANKSLPCGTQVTFRYGGHNVTATVDDRGPYVGAREWDLNQNTASALGFGGVDTVWSSP